MTQSRLYVELSRDKALALSKKVEAAFEDAGFAIATFEADINSDIWAVSAYVDDQTIDDTFEKFQATINASGLDQKIQTEKLADTNWVEETLRELAPVHAERFIVHGSHDSDKPACNQHAICIDASLAFGTGHHGTTAGCLDVLSKVIKRKEITNAADLGTGTGVLAIAIAKSTSAKVLATDIDPVATQVATQNCKLNGVFGQVKLATANGLNHNLIRQTMPFDLIVANILAGPLQKLSRDLASCVADKGTVILSGLLPHQRTRILATYRQYGLRHVNTHIREGWLILELSKG